MLHHTHGCDRQVMQSDELESAAGPFRKQRQKDNGGYFHITIAFSEVCLFMNEHWRRKPRTIRFKMVSVLDRMRRRSETFRVVDEPNHDST
jgi:hypothetical protein